MERFMYGMRLQDNASLDIMDTGGSVNAVAWSPNGSYIASASSDTTVQVWDALQTGEGSASLYTYRGHFGNMRTLAMPTRYGVSRGLQITRASLRPASIELPRSGRQAKASPTLSLSMPWPVLAT
jgi:WD40 repeat protein